MAKNAVEIEGVYPSNCGMLRFEWGDLQKVATAAEAGSNKSGGTAFLVTECRLVGEHLLQGLGRLSMENKPRLSVPVTPLNCLPSHMSSWIDGQTPSQVASFGEDPVLENMMPGKHEITREDIMALPAYEADRKQIKADIIAKKKFRRHEVGPVCCFYFENYDTMWLQVQEMLFIERGGDAQIDDELSAYNPLIPKGTELIATVMFEIDEPVRRDRFLSKLGGVEETAFIRFGGHQVRGIPEADLDRTNVDGKASSVQFLHFPFTLEQIDAFKEPGQQIVIGFDHPSYGHMSVVSEETRVALSKDFD
ncbi:MAG: DUF3501 family protein [Pseudomonadota bacterium]